MKGRKTKRREIIEEILADCVHEESTIECNKCKTIEGFDGDAVSAAAEFFDYGWRIIDGYGVCPKCARKK